VGAITLGWASVLPRDLLSRRDLARPMVGLEVDRNSPLLGRSLVCPRDLPDATSDDHAYVPPMGLTKIKRLRVAVVVSVSVGVLPFLVSGCGGGCRALKTDASACVSHPGLFSIYYLAVDPLHPQTVYVASTDNPVDKSTDGGANWKRIDPWKDNYVSGGGVVLDPRNPKSVYVATSDGVYKSADGGTSWMSAGLQERCGSGTPPITTAMFKRSRSLLADTSSTPPLAPVRRRIASTPVLVCSRALTGGRVGYLPGSPTKTSVRLR